MALFVGSAPDRRHVCLRNEKSILDAYEKIHQGSVRMTRKVFWEDPYLTQLETRVTSVKDNDITVEQTIFYAFAGGQESDHGTIGNIVFSRLGKRVKRLYIRWRMVMA